MFSNSRPEKGSSTSITTRLVVLYLVIMTLTLLSTNWFQFRMLTSDLQHEDNDFLIQQITNLRSIISKHPRGAALHDAIPADKPDDHLRYLVRVQDGLGRTVIESPAIGVIPSTNFPQPVVGGHAMAKPAKFLAADGKHYLLGSAWAEGLGDPHYRLVQVALDDTDEIALMAKYRLKMSISVALGLLLAAVFVIATTRHGLRPLKEMAARVARITETDLHQRVGAGKWPKELDQLTVALDGMLTRLEDSFARLSEFSANLSHELRTPLNNLRGEAEVALSQARSAEEYRRIIESSIEEYERLSRMVGDVLFLARPDSNFAPDLMEARDEIEKVADYYLNFAEEQGISIDIEGRGVIRADQRLFQRAVANVISNALRYNTSGGKVSVAITGAADGGTRIIVQDDGMGIAEEEIPRVFERFFRSPDARLKYNQGSGLGLSIVRSIIALHGGELEISSAPGCGTAVSLNFPDPAPSRT